MSNRSEYLGIEKVIINPTIDHMHRTQALGGSHVAIVFLANQVAALYQFHAHLLCQEAMFKVRRIINAGVNTTTFGSVTPVGATYSSIARNRSG